jgi:hypothetical protein
VVESTPSKMLPGLIRDIAIESRHGQLPRLHVLDLARRRIDAPHEILEWAMRDRRWSFTLAELLTTPVSKPRDLAAMLVTAIIEELEQERELFGADILETSPPAFVEAHAE